MLKKILEVSTTLNVVFDWICAIEKQLYTYVCGTWKTLKDNLLFLAYRNTASDLPLGMESVGRYKFFLGRNKPSLLQ